MALNKKLAVKYIEMIEKDSNKNIEKVKKYFPNAYTFVDKKTDTEGFCNIIDKELIVYFRGTEVHEIKDWLTDIRFKQMVYPYNNVSSKIKVHKGFIDAYKTIREFIHNFISMNKGSFDNIVVIGHSLGGALATLCSIDLQYNFSSQYKNLACYTYGAPKVGNKEFVISYNKRIPDSNRIYLLNDIVPKLPPFPIFSHVKGYHIGPWFPLLGLLELIKRKFKANCLPADLTNHSTKLYKTYLLKK